MSLLFSSSGGTASLSLSVHRVSHGSNQETNIELTVGGNLVGRHCAGFARRTSGEAILCRIGVLNSNRYKKQRLTGKVNVRDNAGKCAANQTVEKKISRFERVEFLRVLA